MARVSKGAMLEGLRSMPWEAQRVAKEAWHEQNRRVLAALAPRVVALSGIREEDVESFLGAYKWAEAHVVSQLHGLTRLDLACQDHLAKADQLQFVLQTLVRLQWLRLRHCGLRQVPAAVAALTALTALDLHNDGLQHITGGWDHLRPLSRLEQLSLASPQLPASVTALPRLTQLRLEWSILQGAVDLQHLPALAQLQSLSLLDCGLQAVPAAVAAMTALTSLGLVDGFPSIDSGWDHLRPLERLQQLSLSPVQLPAVVTALPGLTQLHLIGASECGDDLQQLSALAQLESLKLDCILDSFPSALAALTALTELDLQENRVPHADSSWDHQLGPRCPGCRSCACSTAAPRGCPRPCPA